MHIDQIKNLAKGHWPTILAGIGAPSSCLMNKHGPCPLGCGGRESFRFDDKDGSGSFICTHCGSGKGMTFASKLLGLEDSKDLPKVVAAVSMALGIQPENGEDVFRREYLRAGKASAAYRAAFPCAGLTDDVVHARARRLAKKYQTDAQNRRNSPSVSGKTDATDAQNRRNSPSANSDIVNKRWDHPIGQQSKLPQKGYNNDRLSDSETDRHMDGMDSNGRFYGKNDGNGESNPALDYDNAPANVWGGSAVGNQTGMEWEIPGRPPRVGSYPTDGSQRDDDQYFVGRATDRDDISGNIPSDQVQGVGQSQADQQLGVTSSDELKALRNQQVALQLFGVSSTDMLEVKDYLYSRAITVDPPETIRFLPSIQLDLPHDMAYLNRRKSMMVALVQNGAGDPIAIHHTSLVAPKDDKRRKMMLGPVKGGSIRLGDHPVGGNKMAIGEGIESCLSFMQATEINTWAGMTEGGLRGFELPAEKPSTVYILADVDEEKIIRGVAHRVGQEAASKAAQRIANLGIETYIVWPGDPMGPKIDFNDLLRDDPTGDSIRAALAQAEAVLPHTPPAQPPGNEWLSLLRMGAGSSGAMPNLNNAATVLENHQSFKNMFAFDEFRYACVLTNRPPWESGTGNFVTRDLSDNDSLCLTRWLQGTALGTYAMPRMGVTTAQQAMETIGAKTRIHPIRDWMDSLIWDTKARLSTWLIDYFGVADSPYVQAVARAWLISAIARIYQPGCKADGVLVLVGEQGAKKSQGLKVIGGSWFRDSIFDLSNKDAFLQVRGVWIYELSELSALARADVEKVKAFMSSQVDSYRPPFGRTTVEVPRQLIFAATTNTPEFLKDQTGNRRFWPIDVADNIDIAGLTTARDQLIAEAVAAYKAGEKWWLSKKEEMRAKEEQDSHLAADPWEAKVRSCVKMMDGVTGFTVNDILMQIETDVAKWQVGWDSRIGIILKKLGYNKKRIQNQGVRERRFFHLQKNGQDGQDSASENGNHGHKKDVENQSQWPGCPGCPGFSVCMHRREGGSYMHTHAGCAHIAHQTTAHRGKCVANLANPGHSIENKQLSHAGTLATSLATSDNSNVIPIWPGVMEDEHDTLEGFGDRI